jgi:hypothetical protein
LKKKNKAWRRRKAATNKFMRQALSIHQTSLVKRRRRSRKKKCTGQQAMAEKKVQLLSFWASPFSQRVELALALKGIQYEKLEQNLADKSPLLLASNPVYKKIPVLLHGDHAICESAIILQYIDEAFPDHHPLLLPADAHGRATARFWADFFDKKVILTANPKKTHGSLYSICLECVGSVH